MIERRDPGIVVFGSINIDLVARVSRFPLPGETIGDARFAIHPGGKGANQALAAARAGASVSLIGCVGHDSFAEAAVTDLRDAGVDLSGVSRVDAPTGVACILVDGDGRNMIAVAPGANSMVDPERASSALVPGNWLVVQGELPVPATEAAIRRASRAGAPVLINLAPPVALADATFSLVDCLVVNEHEARVLAGRFDLPDEPGRFAASWRARFGSLAAVTAGERGAFVADRQRTWRQPAAPVEVVDSTGAGDAFVGVLAAALARGVVAEQAVRLAVAAGSLACAAAGARAGLTGRAGLTTRKQLDSLAASLPAPLAS